MTFWINQHLVNTKEAIQQWRTNRNLSVLVVADHIEKASAHLILGLDIAWENRTDAPITVIEMQIIFYGRKKDEVMFRLHPLERFIRHDTGRSFNKKPLSQFTIPPKQIQTEHIRFLSQENIDVPPGTYTVDIRVRDTNHHSYTRRIKIRLENKIKYRMTEDWRELGK